MKNRISAEPIETKTEFTVRTLTALLIERLRVDRVRQDDPVGWSQLG